MIPAKIVDFQKKHGQAFPPFRHIAGTDASALEVRLLSRLGLDSSATQAVQWSQLDSRLRGVAGFNANETGFRLEKVFEQLGIHPSHAVYVAWSNEPGNIDEMPFEQLCRIFSDVWWPSADDIDLFDDSLSWFVRIDHDGNVAMTGKGHH